jgi:hypothetical protein
LVNGFALGNSNLKTHPGLCDDLEKQFKVVFEDGIVKLY